MPGTVTGLVIDPRCTCLQFAADLVRSKLHSLRQREGHRTMAADRRRQRVIDTMVAAAELTAAMLVALRECYPTLLKDLLESGDPAELHSRLLARVDSAAATLADAFRWCHWKHQDGRSCIFARLLTTLAAGLVRSGQCYSASDQAATEAKTTLLGCTRVAIVMPRTRRIFVCQQRLLLDSHNPAYASLCAAAYLCSTLCLQN